MESSIGHSFVTASFSILLSFSRSWDFTFFWYNAHFIRLHWLKPRRSLSSTVNTEFKSVIKMATASMILLLAIGFASRVAAYGFMRTASADGKTWAELDELYQSIQLTVSDANAIIQIIIRFQHALPKSPWIRTMAISTTPDTAQGTSSVTRARHSTACFLQSRQGTTSRFSGPNGLQVTTAIWWTLLLPATAPARTPIWRRWNSTWSLTKVSSALTLMLHRAKTWTA